MVTTIQVPGAAVSPSGAPDDRPLRWHATALRGLTLAALALVAMAIALALVAALRGPGAAFHLLPVGTASAQPPAAHAAALEAAADRRWADALAQWRAAAEAGDAFAAERVGLMLLFGERLYGPQVPRDPDAAARWLEAAARGGSPAALYVRCRQRAGATVLACGSGSLRAAVD